MIELKLKMINKKNAITAQLCEASPKPFFSYRVSAMGGEHQSDYVNQAIEEWLEVAKRLSSRKN